MFIWQWFFPATTLTKLGATGEKRRYHLHDSHVQMAGYDLPTIRRLLGHADVKTTMISVQTVLTIMAKEVKSPLDLA